MDRRAYLQSLSVGLAALSGCGRSGRDRPPSAVATTVSNTTETSTAPTTDSTTASEESAAVRIETVTMNLEVPWGGAFHPESGSLYLTERPGRIRRVNPRNGPEELVGGDSELVADFTDDIEADGEAGLLGLAFHPDNPDLAYTYGTYETDVSVENRLVRHDVTDDFEMEVVVQDGIPAGSERNGGRLGIDLGGALYVTTGDTGAPHRAEDRNSLAGSVLRFTADGDPHPDNPFDSAVFTYGHRNPQGLTVHPDTGAIYTTDRGSERDEINILYPGRDYGWPDEAGGSGVTKPVVTYTPAIEPASATFYDGPIEEWAGELFFGTLAGRHLRRVTIDHDAGEIASQHQLLDAEYGRLRTAFTGPDDHLYVMTSNRDEEGHPAPTDDRVLRIRPA